MEQKEDKVELIKEEKKRDLVRLRVTLDREFYKAIKHRLIDEEESISYVIKRLLEHYLRSPGPKDRSPPKV